MKKIQTECGIVLCFCEDEDEGRRINVKLMRRTNKTGQDCELLSNQPLIIFIKGQIGAEMTSNTKSKNHIDIS